MNAMNGFFGDKTMIQRLILVLIAIFTLAACNRDNVTISPDGEGSTTITVTLSEAEFNTLIATALANTENPLLRDPSVDFQNGQVVISGEHDRRDGNGRVSGTMTMQIQVVNGAIQAQITAVNIQGLDISDERIAELNQRLAEQLAERAQRDNPFTTLSSINITDDAIEINITVTRARG